jgi:hypothetical protein
MRGRVRWIGCCKLRTVVIVKWKRLYCDLGYACVCQISNVCDCCACNAKKNQDPKKDSGWKFFVTLSRIDMHLLMQHWVRPYCHVPTDPTMTSHIDHMLSMSRPMTSSTVLSPNRLQMLLNTCALVLRDTITVSSATWWSTHFGPKPRWWDCRSGTWILDDCLNSWGSACDQVWQMGVNLSGVSHY